jgi:3D (Asp-Asp-Asp) domain-containing protein
VALAAASLILLAVPIARTSASGSESARAPVSAAGDGFVSALRGQAEMVTAMMAPPTAAPDSAARTDYVSRLQSVPGGRVIPATLLAAAGQLAAGAAFTSPETQASMIVQRQGTVSFTLHEEGMTVRETSSQLTVGQALAGLGMTIGPRDTVRPSADSRLTPGLHIYVSYAHNLRLIYNGEERIVYTQADTVGEFLGELGIVAQPGDRVFPDPGDPVRTSMVISVITFRDGVEYTEDPLEYGTVYTYDANYLEGDEVLVSAGSMGYVRREYQITRVNGTRPAGTGVGGDGAGDGRGDRPGTASPATPAPRYVPPVVSAAFDWGPSGCSHTMTVWATWYNAESAGGTRTATGTGVYRGIVAVDPSVIPLGTRMYIPGYGPGLAADTGGGVRGNMIDLGFGDNDVVDWHTRWVDICILD